MAGRLLWVTHRCTSLFFSKTEGHNEMSQLHTHTHTQDLDWLEMAPNKSKDRQQYLRSLSPRHQQPPSSLIWPMMNEPLFFHPPPSPSFLLFFPSSSSLLLLLLSLFYADTGGEEGSGVDECVWTPHSLLLASPHPSPLVFLLFSVFLSVSKRWAGGPLM